VLPPLDADFFRLAQHIDEKSYGHYAKPVLEFVRNEFGPRTLPTLETVFTQLEAFERFLRQFSTRRGRRTGRYQKQLRHLQELIPAVFRAALQDRHCDWHDRMAQSLRSGDAVISFNYDVLIDESLRRYARGIWDASRGYGFQVSEGADPWSAESTPGPFPNEYLRLLKPHGSLHWTKIKPESETLALRSSAYAQQAASTNVIPPTWDKAVLGTWPWKPVWEEASRYLQHVRCLIVIGYSVPPTDLMTQALFKSSLSSADLRLLLVVNPDPVARGRVIDLARVAIKPKTRVIELGALHDFALLLDDTADERRRRSAEVRPLKRAITKLEARLDSYRSDELWEIEDKLEEIDIDEIADLAKRLEEIETKLE
jgi:hypothetical protein